MKTITEIKIRGYHLDNFQHVNNSRYLEFIQEASWSHTEKNNLLNPFHKAGIYHVIARIEIDYIKSSYIGDIIRIETDVFDKTDNSIIMEHRMYLNDTDAILAKAKVFTVYLSSNTGKVVPIDDDFIALWPELAELND